MVWFEGFSNPLEDPKHYGPHMVSILISHHMLSIRLGLGYIRILQAVWKS